ncbi:macrophage mannose receptor 1-like [Mercenaria mercenaria]|uniref:macrophage mannose receptor 1-like n=1 Tax=Mercenaria mercenaria TaxID=6596 RepID=UPI00234F6D02|nr:macrophage mannose receptor 1-like [Mercenaria mercenaria]
MTSSYPNTTDNKIQTTEANTTLHPTELSSVTSLLWQNVSTTDVLRTETPSKRPSHISTTPGITQSPTTHGYSFHCQVKDSFVHLHNSHAQLCVHVVLRHAPSSWDDARAACKRQGADLVVLDTHDKALLMRKELASHPRYPIHEFYWIGAKDFSKHDHFSWVNGRHWNKTAADWSGSQPDHIKHGHDQDCVCMFRDAVPTFKWHDKSCNVEGSYICERK